MLTRNCEPGTLPAAAAGVMVCRPSGTVPDAWHRGPLALMTLTRRRPPRTALLAIAALLAMLLIDPPAIADSEGAATAMAAASPVGGAPFEGFGVSGAWWARDTGRLPDRVRARIARLLFAPSGLHLSQYRYNIGGGGAIATAARYAPGYLRRSGTYDWEIGRAHV